MAAEYNFPLRFFPTCAKVTPELPSSQLLSQRLNIGRSFKKGVIDQASVDNCPAQHPVAGSSKFNFAPCKRVLL